MIDIDIWHKFYTLSFTTIAGGSDELKFLFQFIKNYDTLIFMSLRNWKKYFIEIKTLLGHLP